MRNTKNLMLGLVSTFAAGAVLGILFAPEKGNRTRRKIMRTGKDLFRKVDHTLEDGKASLEEIRDVLKDNLDKVSFKLEKIS